MNTQNNSPLDILKSALLLEMRGRSFYSKVAAQSENENVKAFFTMMAEEEEQHVRELTKQYKAYKEGGTFVPSLADGGKEVADKVITSGLKDQINAASFEAAAVAAAMNMEERAIRLYSDQAKSAAGDEERAVYEWLADWERRHLQMLADIDRELTEDIWNDNSFWPY